MVSPFRKHFKKALASVVTIQKNYRAHLYQKRYLQKCSAVLVLQRHRRGQVARSICRKLREEKKKREEEENRKKAEEEKVEGAEGAQVNEGEKNEEAEGEQVSTEICKGPFVHQLFQIIEHFLCSFLVLCIV